MKILALDFSSTLRSVALRAEESTPILEVVDTTPGRDMKPFALIESVLRQAGLEREAVEALVIGIGPGSYTGIRVAISLAQGWQLATGVKLLATSSVAAIAAQAVSAGVTGRFDVVIDAQRGEFYRAGYEASRAGTVEIAPVQLATRAEVEAGARSGNLLVGPEVTRWFPQGKLFFPHAASLASLAAGRSDFLRGEELEPIYLRETTFIKAPPARVLPESS